MRNPTEPALLCKSRLARLPSRAQPLLTTCAVSVPFSPLATCAESAAWVGRTVRRGLVLGLTCAGIWLAGSGALLLLVAYLFRPRGAIRAAPALPDEAIAPAQPDRASVCVPDFTPSAQDRTVAGILASLDDQGMGFYVVPVKDLADQSHTLTISCHQATQRRPA